MNSTNSYIKKTISCWPAFPPHNLPNKCSEIIDGRQDLGDGVSVEYRRLVIILILLHLIVSGSSVGCYFTV